MSLKALAEQRLAAIGAHQHGAVRWASRDVPAGQAGGARVEQRQRGGLNYGRVEELSRFLGFATPDELTGVLRDFATGRRMVEVNPGPEEGLILIASDDATIDPGERRVVYRASELRVALDLPLGVLHELHRMKRVFGGTLEPS